MSEDTTTAAVDPNAEAKAALSQIGPIENNGVAFDTTPAEKRGKAKGEVYLAFVGGEEVSVLTRMAQFVGVADFVRSVWRDSILPASQDAYSEAYDEEQDKFSPAKFLARFLDNFRSGKRMTAGPLLKELKEQREVAYAELLAASTELETLLADPAATEQDKEAAKSKVNRAILTCTQLSASIQKKERIGKGKAKK